MSDQAYYWTPEWQADEKIAAEELARGEGVEFASAAEAVRWLADDGETGRHVGALLGVVMVVCALVALWAVTR